MCVLIMKRWFGSCNKYTCLWLIEMVQYKASLVGLPSDSRHKVVMDNYWPSPLHYVIFIL